MFLNVSQKQTEKLELKVRSEKELFKKLGKFYQKK